MFSIRDLLTHAAGQIDTLDAELLIAHVLKQDRAFVVAHPEHLVTRAQKYKSVKLMQKRKAGMPIAYLTQHKEFYGLDFFVNKHTLIPRPETEMLVSLALDKLQNADFRLQNVTLIDIGTGSGCIPLSILKTIAQINPKSEIYTLKSYATDISRSALRMAKKNAKKHDVDITFLHGNLLTPIINQSAICNLQSEILITANLPYLTEEQYKNSPTPEIHYEPKSALLAKDNGLELYKKLLHQIYQYRTSNISAYGGQYHTTCFFEIDPSQSEPLSHYAQTIFPKALIDTHKDLSGCERVFRMRLCD